MTTKKFLEVNFGLAAIFLVGGFQIEKIWGDATPQSYLVVGMWAVGYYFVWRIVRAKYRKSRRKAQ